MMDLMPKLEQPATRDEIVAAISLKADIEVGRQRAAISDESVAKSVGDEFDRLDEALTADTDEWKYLVPGRPVLARWAQHVPINLRTAKSLYLEAADKSGNAVFQEILDIFEQFERL
jgi:hypothetical protein